MTVYIVSLEWNQPPSEVTGDTGIVGVFADRAAADRCALAECQQLDNEGQKVWEFSMTEDRYCAFCGEEIPVGMSESGCHTCPERDEPGWCDYCGAELKETGDCDNDHNEWDIDVHVTEHEVQS